MAKKKILVVMDDTEFNRELVIRATRRRLRHGDRGERCRSVDRDRTEPTGSDF